MYADIKDKVVIVTGAGREGGLGAGIALRLGREGARVVVHDIGDRLKTVVGGDALASVAGMHPSYTG